MGTKLAHRPIRICRESDGLIVNESTTMRPAASIEDCRSVQMKGSTCDHGEDLLVSGVGGVLSSSVLGVRRWKKDASIDGS